MKTTKRLVLYEVPKFRVRCISGHKWYYYPREVESIKALKGSFTNFMATAFDCSEIWEVRSFNTYVAVGCKIPNSSFHPSQNFMRVIDSYDCAKFLLYPNTDLCKLEVGCLFFTAINILKKGMIIWRSPVYALCGCTDTRELDLSICVKLNLKASTLQGSLRVAAPTPEEKQEEDKATHRLSMGWDGGKQWNSGVYNLRLTKH